MRKRALQMAVAVTGGLVAFLSMAEQPADRLQQAIRQNDLKALDSILKHDNVNAKDERGATPLMLAATVGSLDAMKALVSKGADVNAVTSLGITPLMLAMADADKVRYLVDHGADVNAQSKMGRTPLLIAASTDGASDTVRLLAAHGARTDVQDSSKTTPLLAAAKASDTATIRFLVGAGADVNARNVYDITPLMYAAGNDNLDAVRFLLAHGADAKAVSGEQTDRPVKNGPLALGLFTPLLLGAPYGGEELEKALLDAGADINARDVRGMTALMMAIATDHADPRTVRLLLDRGADRTIKDKEGRTAADWARKFNHEPILSALGLQREPNMVSPAPAGETLPVSPADAAAKAVALLERGSAEFFKGSGCGSCHSQNLTAVAVGAAAASQVPFNAAMRAQELMGARLGLGTFEQMFLQRVDPPVGEILSYAFLQFSAGGAEPDHITDALLYNLAAQQKRDGSWHEGFIARPPMEDGDLSRTAMAVRALVMYGAPGLKEEYAKRIQRAAAWIEAAKPVTTEDLDMQLLGLAWAKTGEGVRAKGVQTLLASQRPDGGFAQTSDLPSDAYATGQALYTLHTLGVPANSPAYRRGVQFLLRTQAADGSWHVKSRAQKFQPYFESGFPHGHDQWISSSGTAWAAAALSYASAGTQVPAITRSGSVGN